MNLGMSFRNTPNVTGFIGVGTIPTPIGEEEIKSLRNEWDIEEPKFKIDVVVGDLVKITEGPFKNMEGKITNLTKLKERLKLMFPCLVVKPQ